MQPIRRTPTSLYRPSVRLIARTQLNDLEFSKALGLVEENKPLPIFQGLEERLDKGNGEGDGEALIEFAGRNCYQSFHNPAGRTNDEYIANIQEKKHFSVIEHVNVTFFIENVDRALSHELIRHRHFSYSELSQRYVDNSDSKMVVPPLYRQDHELWLEFVKGVERSREAYKRLADLTEKRHPGMPRKQVREAARRVLPEATATKVVVTGNLRAWREFLEKRFSKHADASIMEVAEEIYHILQKEYPVVFGDVEFQSE